MQDKNIAEDERQEVLWLTDEFVGNFKREHVHRALTLVQEMLKLIGNCGFEHRIQDPVADISALFENVRSSGIERPNHIVCLDNTLRDFAHDAFPGSVVHDLHLTRLRDVSTRNMDVVSLPMTGGASPESIRKSIANGGPIGIIDTIAFGAGTALKAADLIGAEKPVFLMVGITPTAINLLEERGKVLFGFMIKKPVVDLWHVEDFFKPVTTIDGATIEPVELVELLMPVFKGEMDISHFLEAHRIDRFMKNPNLFLNAWRGAPLGAHLDPGKIVDRIGQVKSILMEITGIMHNNASLRMSLESAARQEHGVENSHGASNAIRLQPLSKQKVVHNG